MSPWFWGALYILAGILASRWTVGHLINSDFGGSVDDAEEWMFAGMVFTFTVAIWPIGAVAAALYGAIKLASLTPLNTWIKWFYTLDRDSRKEMLK